MALLTINVLSLMASHTQLQKSFDTFQGCIVLRQLASFVPWTASRTHPQVMQRVVCPAQIFTFFPLACLLAALRVLTHKHAEKYLKVVFRDVFIFIVRVRTVKSTSASSPPLIGRGFA